nr:4,5-DOPA dioxygenase extradiol [Olivibacter sitiensis]
MDTLKELHALSNLYVKRDAKMPVLFVGHGSPMNAIEDNDFTRRWASMAKEIPLPNAVLVISAHWYASATLVTAMEHPKTIHDFYGFPKELFEVDYPAPGNPALARALSEDVMGASLIMDHDWGLDHGAWSVVKHMYPDANIPVLQLSIDYTKSPAWHYALAQELSVLREHGILIIGSGNMVHNLRMLSWQMIQGGGYDWAYEMNDTFKRLISEKKHNALIHYDGLGSAAQLAIPTPEHYLPLLYSLAMQEDREDLAFFNDKVIGGSLTMTSVKIGK